MNKKMYKSFGFSNHADIEREKLDFYATDPKAIDALFSVEEFSDLILEPAAGQGHLSKRMKQFGKQVLISDIIDRGLEGVEIADFLEYKGIFQGDIITNPPYKHATEFVYRALDNIMEGAKVAMFLRIQFLESIKREKLFKKFPPTNIWVFSKRIGCKRGGGIVSNSSMACYAWFVWTKGNTSLPILGWI